MLTKSVDILTVIAEQVALVCGNDLRSAGKLGAILVQLGVNCIKILNGVASLAAGYIDKMNKQTAAVNVPQKVMPKPRTLGCTLDNARNIRHYKRTTLIDIHDAEVREEGGEVIVCNFRVGLADNAEQR